MPEIKSHISISEDSLKKISNKVNCNDFSYKSWNDEDLITVRKEIRDFYRIEQKGICCYCRKEVSLTSSLNCHVEHIVPKSLHEEYMFEPKNLCVVCADCNEIKREQETLGTIPETIKNANSRKRYPHSSNSFLIVHPHFDLWDEHILVFNDLYVDKTTKGHFTIGACRLNRKLHKFGWEEFTIDDKEMNTLMNNFLNEKDTMKRMRILKKIKLG